MGEVASVSAAREPAGWQYDLFVTYAEADREWVHGYLVPALGLPPERLQTPEDFRPGAPVVVEFGRAIAESRFTAVILSSAYLADDWAVFGEQLASHAGAAERRDTVIPVLRSREPVPLRVGFRVPIDCTDQRRWEQQVARLRDLLGRSEPAPETLPCPYPGMVPFQGDNARFFYGREAEVEDLVRRLRHQHFLMVIGPSGSGKSSLVFAGVLPRLAERHGRDWLVRSMRPGGKPLQALLAVLEGRVAVTTDEGWRHLLDGLLRVRSHAGRVLLVVDQLEEIFTQAPPDTRAGFLSAVRALAQHESCVLVLTMRADFYPDLMTSDLWPLPGERAEVAPLRGAALKRAVEQPAARVGVHLEPGLLERLLADAANEPGVLPLVQETMVLLWEQRQRRLLTQSAYDALGTDGQSGVAVALATKAEATLSTLTPVEQAIARRIFRRLVQLGEGRDDTRRQQPVSALRGREEPSSFDHVLHHLTNHRLLTVSGDERGEERRVDLSHEALISAWPTLRRWVSEDRDGLRIQQELSEDARGWVKLDRDPGALYRGARLATAREWADTRADELNPLEREFLEASRAREVDEIEEAHRRADEQARSARRLRVVVAGLALFLVIASVSTVLAVRAFNNARAAEIDATSRGLAAQATADTENLPRSLLASLEALRVKDTPDARGALLASLERSPGATRVLTGGAQVQVQSLALSRNGEIVAAAGDDKVIRLWSVRTGQPVRAPLTGHRAPVSSIAFSPDGVVLAAGGEDGTVRLWNLNTGTQALLWAHDAGEVRVAFDPTGKRLVSAGKDRVVRLWDPRTAEPLGKPMRGHIGPVTAVAFSADGRTLASGSADHDIRLWELRPSPRLRQRLKGHSNGVTSVAFSPDGTTLVSGAYDETLRIWDVRSGTQRREPLRGHKGDVISVAFSPDGTTLASGSEDETVRLWDTEDWTPRGVLSGHSGTVTSVAFGRNRATLASGGHDGTVILWNLRSVSRLGERLRGHRRHANSAAFSPDGGAIAASGADGKVWLWNVPARRLQGGPLQGHQGTVTSVAFSPDGALLVTCAHDGAVRLWDARTGEPRGRPMSGHAGMVETVAFSRDGRLIASGGEDGTVRLWDVATQQPVGKAMTGHQGTVRAVAFAPDGATLASGGDDKTLRFWDVERQQQLGKGLPFPGSVASLAFNRDGTMLALGLWEVSHVVLWDVRQRRPWSEPLAGSLHGVNAVAFSPDGKTLASGSRDRTVRLWSVESQETPRPLGEPLTGHEASVQGLAFSPGGEMLVSAGEDGMVMLWDMRIGSWKRKACALANRNLSRSEWDHLLPHQDYRRTCPEFPPGPEAPPGP